MTPTTDGRPALLATDLDGTLLRSDGTVGPRTLAALAAAADRGFEVAFVTGRPPRWVPPVLDLTGHLGSVLCANGAAVLDLSTGRVCEVHGMSDEVVLETVSRLRELIPGMGFALELTRVGASLEGSMDRLTDFGIEPDFPVVRALPEGVRRLPMPALLDAARRDGTVAIKLLARDNSGLSVPADVLAEQAAAALEGFVEVTHSASSGMLLEISGPGVTKESALASLARELGLGAARVAAVGDMPNDLPMLRWAGHSYAVANAHPAVLALVDGHLPSNDEDGVATLLEQLIAGGIGEAVSR